MTREKAIDWLCRLKSEIKIFMPYQWQKPFEEALDMAIKVLEQEPNTWSLDDAREDFMYDVYNTLDFLPTNEEANRIIDSFDRVTSSIKQEPIIDKIRAEIEQLKLHKAEFLTSDNKVCIDSQEVLNVIDKYKGESEG